MLSKLACRNVRRQLGNYVIYFITVSLTVALMFAVNNVIFDKDMLVKASAIRELKAGLTALTVIVSLIVAFVLGYASSFMLKLRKREFGTYLTLGLTRKNILSVFLLESLILCAVSLGAGLLTGLAAYQGVMAVVTNILGMEFTLASYSVRGFLLTAGLVLLMFSLSSATSAVYLRLVDIITLLRGSQKSDKRTKFPGLWLGITVVSLAAVVASCVVFRRTIPDVFGDSASSMQLVFYVLTLAAAIFLFHIGLSKSVFVLLLRSKKFKNKGTNTFILRSLSGKANTNAVMIGVLSVLISFAVIGANLSSVLQSSGKLALDRDNPFDISAEIPVGGSPIGPARADEIIAGYADIEWKISYSLYTTGDNYLLGFAGRSGDGYEKLTDLFIGESDFNKLTARLGYAPVDLNGGFLIAANPAYAGEITATDFSQAALSFGVGTLGFSGFADAPLSAALTFAAVVPDEYLSGVKKAYDGLIYDLKDGEFDAAALREALTYEIETSSLTLKVCDFDIREYARLQLNAMNAVYTVAALYIAFVFVCMAMAILSLKTLSEISDNRRRFDTLYKIGADSRERCRALFYQTFVFFFLPFVLPLLLSIPTGIICFDIMTLARLPAATAQIAFTTAAVALILFSVYVLYFTATYLSAKRSVIRAS